VEYGTSSLFTASLLTFENLNKMLIFFTMMTSIDKRPHNGPAHGRSAVHLLAKFHCRTARHFAGDIIQRHKSALNYYIDKKIYPLTPDTYTGYQIHATSTTKCLHHFVLVTLYTSTLCLYSLPTGSTLY